METTKIGISCFLGAFIGSFIAIQIGTVGWPIGAIIGAFVAYLVYNLKEVVTAIPVAYRRTVNWRPDHEFWSLWRLAFRCIFNLFVNMTVGSCFLITLGHVFFWTHTPFSNRIIIQTEGIIFLIGISFGVLTGLLFSGNLAKMALLDHGYHLQQLREYPNVFRLYFWILPRGIVMGFVWFVLGVPAGIVIVLEYGMLFFGIVMTFLIGLFRLVHSELRLLCAVDAALGTAIGYFTGNALIGAIAGGLLGVANYEIITIRVMQVAGAKSIFR